MCNRKSLEFENKTAFQRIRARVSLNADHFIIVVSSIRLIAEEIRNISTLVDLGGKSK